jgi:hypothetical protein
MLIGLRVVNPQPPRYPDESHGQPAAAPEGLPLDAFAMWMAEAA